MFVRHQLSDSIETFYTLYSGGDKSACFPKNAHSASDVNQTKNLVSTTAKVKERIELESSSAAASTKADWLCFVGTPVLYPISLLCGNHLWFDSWFWQNKAVAFVQSFFYFSMPLLLFATAIGKSTVNRVSHRHRPSKFPPGARDARAKLWRSTGASTSKQKHDKGLFLFARHILFLKALMEHPELFVAMRSIVVKSCLPVAFCSPGLDLCWAQHKAKSYAIKRRVIRRNHTIINQMRFWMYLFR